jgi:hypothetical protein
MFKLIKLIGLVWLYGVLCHFQQYFSYIMVVSFIGINKSYEVCGGSSDQYKACIFDYLATGDTSFAADTQSSNTEAESETSQIRKDICYVLCSCKFCLFLINIGTKS